MSAQPVEPQHSPAGERPAPPAIDLVALEEHRQRAVDEAADRAREREQRAMREAAQSKEAARAFLARLTGRLDSNAKAAHDVDPDAIPWDDVGEHRARLRERAWVNDLAEASMSHLARHTVDELDREHQIVVRRFVEMLGTPNPTVLNLVLAGNIGAGKSTAAITAGHLAIAKGKMPRFVSHNRYLAMLRPDGNPGVRSPQQVRALYRNADLLILDDLGAEQDVDTESTQFVRTETVDLLGDRIGAGRATIVTTNVGSVVIRAVYGDRIYSRLAGPAYALRFEGADRRRPVSW